MEAYTKALALKPDEWWLYDARRWLYEAQGQWDRAAADLAPLLDPATGELRPDAT